MGKLKDDFACNSISVNCLFTLDSFLNPLVSSLILVNCHVISDPLTQSEEE